MNRALLPIMLLTFGLAPVRAAPDRTPALAGMAGLAVRVDPLSEDILASGIKPEEIQRDVEGVLTREGLPVDPRSSSWLVVTINARCSDRDLCTFSVELELREPAIITRTDRPDVVGVWSTGEVSGCTRKNLGKFIQDLVHLQIAEFATAFRRANGGGGIPSGSQPRRTAPTAAPDRVSAPLPTRPAPTRPEPRQAPRPRSAGS